MLKFEYKLRYEEIYEAFFLLNAKWSKKVRFVLAAVLTAIGVGMLIAYGLDSMKIHYFIIAIFDILLLYYLIYVPVLKSKRGAKAVSKKGGIYKVELTDDGFIRSEAEKTELAGDKDARGMETDGLFVIRPDRAHTFCIPKRVMKDDEQEHVRELLRSKIKYYVR